MFKKSDNQLAEGNPEVNNYLNSIKIWQDETKELRRILLQCKLNEEFKWGKPCYSYQNNNIVLIHGFKNYCALLFINGVLLSDSEGILVRQTDNVQAARQIRFTSSKEVCDLESTIKTYVIEAIEIENSGLKINFKKTSEYNIPDEFQKQLNENTVLKDAFSSLTPGRQREYLLYFSSAKQSKTRETRVEKYTPKILSGKGFKD